MAASTVTRSSLTDDDGTGTTGSIINNTELQKIYAAIDQLLSGTGSYTTLELGGNLKVDGTITGVITTQLQQSFRGLTLRTHPDNDKAANQVAVLGLDEIILDDGVRYSGLTLPLTADITTGGGGGLDTGSRTASKWYEIWLIGKSATKAASDLKLLLHRAKEYTLDQNATTSNAGLSLRFAGPTKIKIAGKFTPGTTGSVEFIDTHIAKIGSPTGNMWLTLEADSAGHPSGTPLATSEKIDVSKITTSEQALRFVFRSPVSLTAATAYWLVFQGDYTASNVNYINLAYNTGGAANGISYSDDGSSWATMTGTLWFKEFVTVTNSTPSMPAGYDEKAKIGYVYNSSGNALVAFTQQQRIVTFLSVTGLGTTSNAFATLFDASGVLPPTPVMADVGMGIATVGVHAAISGTSSGYGVSNAIDGDGGSKLVWAASSNSAFASGGYVRIPTEYQSFYFMVQSGYSAQALIHGFEWGD